MQQVGKRKFDAPLIQLLQPRSRIPHIGKMRLHLLIVGINFAPLSAPHPQRLNRTDHNTAMIADVMRSDMRELRNIKHPNPTIKSLIQHLPIRMARGLQRLNRLLANGIRRHQPEHHRIILLNPRIASNRHGMSSQNRLPPTRGQAQTNIRHIWQLL